MSSNETKYLVRDNSGNYHEMDRKTCGHCKQLLQIGEEYHPECVRNFKEREAVMLIERRKTEDLKNYGEVLSDTERLARQFPNNIAIGYNETYNQRLARQTQEKQQAYYKKLADRTERKRQLPAAEYRLKWLKETIQRDEEEELEEAREKDSSK